MNINTKNVYKLLVKQNFYYNKADKTFAQCLYNKSAATYKYLRNTLQLKLPSVSLIYKWSPIQFIKPGINEILMAQHRAFFANLPEISKICVLCFDEITIKQDLTHNTLTDRIEGFYDDGGARKNELATSALFFMVRSIIMDWKYVINYVLINKSVVAEIDVIRKIVDRDSNNKCKILPKIGRKHIYRNGFKKITVSLAAQLLSNTVSCAIRTVE